MAAPSRKTRSGRAALAIAAHPDDIEFLMAGTLLLLKQAGYEIHTMNLSSGSCGSLEHGPEALRRIRRREAQAAAKILGAHLHPSLADDLEIIYDLKLLRRLAAVIREVNPTILLIPSPQDYMEDHTNTCRLAVTAAFTRGMPNFKTIPARPIVESEVALYHGMPHGLRDGLRQKIRPTFYVNTASVHSTKLKSLAAHQSQQGWLDASQKLNSYLKTLDDMSRELGRMSKKFTHAEGWRRHSHLGFASESFHPLQEALKDKCWTDRAAENALEKGI